MIPLQILEGLFPRSVGLNLVFNILAMLDRISFTIFGWVMQAIFDIANTTIVSPEVFADFQNRVYVILGIFMVFKVTISLLTYLVSPDKINDKEKGMGKMVTRTIVVICMLIGLPFAFDLLNRAQGPLLEAIPRIMIGTQTNTKDVGEQAGGIADTISWTVFQLSLNPETVSLLESEGINTVAGATKVITDPSPIDSSEYKYFYIPVIGTIFALIMAFLLVGFCIDVAIRSFKLVILRMMAPIPIISYIDPKQAKDGAFAGWTKALISTWLDLFLRLAILYFVLYMIDLVIIQNNTSIINNEIGFLRNTVVIVFLIIGLLFFAKQAPKFISDALGIKNSKGMGLGLGAMFAGGAALIGGGGIAGMMKASGDYMTESAEAGAQGKGTGPAWSKGRDVAAQIKSGDKNAKGKTIAQKGIDAMMRASAATHGVTAKNVDAEKTALYRSKDAASNAAIYRNRFMEHGLSGFSNDELKYISSAYSTAINDSKTGLEGKNIESWTSADWNKLANYEATNAAKMEKKYQKLEYYATNRGINLDKPIPKEIGVSGFGRLNPANEERDRILASSGFTPTSPSGSTGPSGPTGPGGSTGPGGPTGT